MKVCNAIILLLLIAVLSACGSNEVEERPIDQGKDYYPIEVGSSWTYVYDSIVYNRQFRTIDTLTGYIQETISNQLSDIGGHPNYRIERLIKKSEGEPWTPNTVWSVNVEDSRLIRTEENLPFIKLLFPTTIDVEWDGNAFIDQFLDVDINGDPIQMFINWDYVYKERLDSKEVEGKTYTDVLLVEEVDTDDSFSRRLSKSYYARGIGLIEKEMIILDCSNCSNELSWDVKGDKGFRHSLRLMN